VIVTVYAVSFDLSYFVPALLLLWFPRQWLRVGTIGRRARGMRARDWVPNRDRQPGDLSVWLGEELVKGRNWVDFFRSLAGGAAVGGTLFTGVAALAPADVKPEPIVFTFILGLKGFVLLIGLVVQAFRFEKKLSLFAPIFYLQGLAFGLIGLKATLVSIVLAWTVNALLPSAGVMLAVFGCLEIIAGLFFGRSQREVLIAGGLTLLPVFLSLVLKRRLAQFTKKTKIIAGSSSSAG
jgi:hypothetical protein